MGNVVEMPGHGQIFQLEEGLFTLRRGLTVEQSQRLLMSLDVVRAIAEGQVDPAKIRGEFSYRVSVDYMQTVAALLKAGKYDWVNEDVSDAHFPIVGTGTATLDFTLVPLGRNAAMEAVLAEHERRGLRPATNHELLTFAITFPEVQRKFLVAQRKFLVAQRKFLVAQFGSIWTDRNGNRTVSYLAEGAGGRGVGLCLIEGGWRGVYHFLAVRKSA